MAFSPKAYGRFLARQQKIFDATFKKKRSRWKFWQRRNRRG
jgi:hypothetical protein